MATEYIDHKYVMHDTGAVQYSTKKALESISRAFKFITSMS